MGSLRAMARTRWTSICATTSPTTPRRVRRCSSPWRIRRTAPSHCLRMALPHASRPRRATPACRASPSPPPMPAAMPTRCWCGTLTFQTAPQRMWLWMPPAMVAMARSTSPPQALTASSPTNRQCSRNRARDPSMSSKTARMARACSVSSPLRNSIGMSPTGASQAGSNVATRRMTTSCGTSAMAMVLAAMTSCI